jgi:hypothetical protein
LIVFGSDGKPKSINAFDWPSSLVSDGVRLYFTEGTAALPGFSVAQASTAGGETTQAPTVAGQYVTVQDFSPARSELLVTSGVLDQPQAAVELWAQPVPAGAPHRVGDVLAQAACWMPGGSYIVYARQRDLYAARSDESEARKLVTMSGFPFAIRVSPHLARVYFRLGQT